MTQNVSSFKNKRLDKIRELEIKYIEYIELFF